MSKTKIKYLLVFLSFIGVSGLCAQENVIACGGVATGAGGTVSFSLGQVVYNMNEGTNGTVSQGIQA